MRSTRTALPSGEGVHGLFDRFRALPRPRRWAALAGGLWTVLVAGYGVGFLAARGAAPGGGPLFLDVMSFAVALALPLVALALAARLAEELDRQRQVVAALAELAAPLFHSLEATREALERQPPAPASPPPAPEIAAALDRLLAGQARLEAALARLARAAPPAAAPQAPEPPRPVPAAPDPPAPEPAAPDAGEPAPSPGWAALVRALDFPRDADDRDGFEALRAALRHQSLAQTLQAAEDVLNMLAQRGVYMDDLAAAPPDPAAWRRFVAGERGAGVAAVGSVRDEDAIEAARGLLGTDPIFRDTALFFQRRFDAVLSEFAAQASDADLTALAATRSGRAFALLARCTGAFG